MNLEHRLQHAARELREVTIDVPPLGTRAAATGMARRTRLVPALAAPILFAAGALFAVGAVRSVEQPVHSDIGVVGTVIQPAADPVVVDSPGRAPTVDGAPAIEAPSIHEELEMISEFLADSRVDAPLGDGEPAAPEPAAASVDGIGPI